MIAVTFLALAVTALTLALPLLVLVGARLRSVRMAAGRGRRCRPAHPHGDGGPYVAVVADGSGIRRWGLSGRDPTERQTASLAGGLP
jgi:hypothetical protein